ncbi:MAG: hypothetical protein JSR12_00310 [Bacteroidetes bacterium]|nr:hypothetical protein [Bacteroidota bacterium]
MFNFLKLLIEAPAYIAELVAFVISAILLIRTRNKESLFFFILLALTCFVELGSAYQLFTIKKTNNWIFNIFNPIEFSFYVWLYYKNTPVALYRKKMLIGLFALYLFYIIDTLFIQGVLYLSTYAYITGCILLIYCVFNFYQYWLNTITVTTIKVMQWPMFWVSIGVFIFFGGEVFLMSYFQYFLNTHKMEILFPVWSVLSNLLNIILYTCLSISFLMQLKSQPKY